MPIFRCAVIFAISFLLGYSQFAFSSDKDQKTPNAAAADLKSQPVDQGKLDKDLLSAVENADLDAVRALVKAGANPNYVSFFGSNVFKEVLSTLSKRNNAYKYPETDSKFWNSIPILEVLLRSQHPITSETQKRLNPNSLSSVLLEATKLSHSKLVELCIKLGADVESRDSDGKTVLIIASERDFRGMVNYLLVIGKANINSKDKSNRTAFEYAINNGNEGVALSLIRAGNIDVNARDKDGKSPLDIAAFYGYHWIARRLIDEGKAVVDAKGDGGKTPLFWAIKGNEPKTIELLVDRNADMKLVVKDDQKASLVSQSVSQDEKDKLLIAAVKNRDVAEIVKLTKRGADPYRALFAAGGYLPRYDILYWLLLWVGNLTDEMRTELSNSGRDNHFNPESGFDPMLFQEAVILDNAFVVELLMSMTNFVSKRIPKSGNTFLMEAVKYGSENVAQLLIRKITKASLSLENKNGETALDIAVANGHDRIAAMLLENGATFKKEKTAERVVQILTEAKSKKPDAKRADAKAAGAKAVDEMTLASFLGSPQPIAGSNPQFRAAPISTNASAPARADLKLNPATPIASAVPQHRPAQNVLPAASAPGASQIGIEDADRKMAELKLAEEVKALPAPSVGSGKLSKPPEKVLVLVSASKPVSKSAPKSDSKADSKVGIKVDSSEQNNADLKQNPPLDADEEKYNQKINKEKFNKNSESHRLAEAAYQKALEADKRDSDTPDVPGGVSAGVPHDEKEALKWYHRAALLDHEDAIFKLNKLGGIGDRKFPIPGHGPSPMDQGSLSPRSRELWRLARLGDGRAQFEVGKFYDGEHENKNSWYWYQRAALNGNRDAQSKLASFLEGNGYSSELARFWRKKAETKTADELKQEREKRNEAFVIAAILGDLEKLRKLHDEGVDIEFKYDGDTALDWAVLLENEAMARFLVNEGKANVNIKNSEGDSPLTLAVLNKNEAIVRLLVNEGKADVNIKDSSGFTVLHKANMPGREKIADFLREKGAVLGKDLEGGIPVNPIADAKSSPLFDHKSDSKSAPITTQTAKSTPTTPVEKADAFTAAVLSGDFDAIKGFIRDGVNPNNKDHRGFNALDWADLTMRDEIAAYLREKGAVLSNKKDPKAFFKSLLSKEGNPAKPSADVRSSSPVDHKSDSKSAPNSTSITKSDSNSDGRVVLSIKVADQKTQHNNADWDSKSDTKGKSVATASGDVKSAPEPKKADARKEAIKLEYDRRFTKEKFDTKSASHQMAEKAYRLGLEAKQENDEKEAIKWFQRAALFDSEEALKELDRLGGIGNPNYLVLGHSAHPPKVELWQHAEAGNGKAQYEVGKKFEPKNENKLKWYWYQRSALNGNADAQVKLGLFLEDNGYPRSLALFWYKKAADQGNQEAKTHYASLSLKLKHAGSSESAGSSKECIPSAEMLNPHTHLNQSPVGSGAGAPPICK